jgi:hypothetical protein
VVALASGCAATGQQLAASVTADKPAPPVSRVVAIWSNQIVTGVDPAHGATPMYGLAGRVLLLSADLKENLLADGRLVVELYAPPPGQPEAPPVKMESWEIKKDILNSVYQRTDIAGRGYSLSLPWPSYRPDITRVMIRVHYEPAKGVPVITQDSLALDGGPIAPPVYSRRTETGNGQPIAAAAPPGAPPQAAAPLRGMGAPAGAAPPFAGGLQPVGGMQAPGGVQQAGGMLPPVEAMAPPAGQFAPACVVQPAGAVPAPYQAQAAPSNLGQPAAVAVPLPGTPTR